MQREGTGEVEKMCNTLLANAVIEDYSYEITEVQP